MGGLAVHEESGDNMIDIEKIKKQLTTQIAVAQELNSPFAFMSVGAVKELLNVIEAQTPTEAELEGGGCSWWYVCGNCHTSVNENDNYCRECGKMLHFGMVEIETGGENA